MRSEAIKPGDVIAGKYRVRAIMSRSRGFLVEAFHTEFDQRVAIRVLSPHLVDEKEVERFRREARTLAKLESEHVARIVDVGTTKDGAFYFARQYLEGQDLASVLKQRGALPFAEAIQYILQAAEAVAETHTHNIILRELQPAHLFLTQRLGGQQVKIIDFGTAKLMRDAAAPSANSELTATSMFGLSCYSSPELIRKAQHVDVRTDVWSLGAILYQLLTARPPFTGEMAALMLAITRDDPVPITRQRGDVPPDIDKIISWSLAKDPDGRFANVHGFAHALTPFAAPEGQILIKRIGEITTAAKQRRREHVPVADPVSLDGTDLVEDDDPRTAYRPPGATAPSPHYQGAAAQAHPGGGDADAPPLERTVFIAQDYPAPAAKPGPSAGQNSGRASQPNIQPVFGGGAADAGRPSQPNWQPMAGPIPAFGAAAPPAAAPEPRRPPPAAAMATIQSSSAPGGFASANKPPPKAQKVALAAVAGAVLLLSVVAVLVVFKGRSSAESSVEGTSASAVASSTPTAGAPSAAPVASAAPSAEPAATPTPSAEPVAAAKTAEPTTGPATHAASTATSHSKAKTAEPVSTPAPTPPPATGGGDNGTLVAVAVGGSCAFSVNGASKGTTSTLKLSLKPGTYSVTCAPSSGSSKSKSVTVTSGGTAMAMFKL